MPNPRPVVPAHVVFQRSSRVTGDALYDHEQNIDDIAPALDRFELKALSGNANDIYDGAFNYGDDIYEQAVELGLVHDWDGPFDLTICNDYYDYVEWRKTQPEPVPVHANNEQFYIGDTVYSKGNGEYIIESIESPTRIHLRNKAGRGTATAIFPANLLTHQAPQNLTHNQLELKEEHINKLLKMLSNKR